MATVESEWILRSKPDGSTVGSYIDNIIVSYAEFRPETANPGNQYSIWYNSTNSHVYIGSFDIQSGVYGTAPTTINAIPRWSDVGATHVVNSGVTISASNLVAGAIGMSLTAEAANPGGATTIWYNSGNSHLYIGAADMQSGVYGTAPTVVDAIPRWSDITATHVVNSGVSISASNLMSGAVGMSLTAGVANPGGAATVWVNSGDSRLYFGASAVGDVVGPASAVVNQIATYNNVSGKLVKDSGVELVEGANPSHAGYNGVYMQIPDGGSATFPAGSLPLLMDTGSENVAVGFAGGSIPLQTGTSSQNTLFGLYAGNDPNIVAFAGCNRNIAIGYKAAHRITACADNIIIGTNAGSALVSPTGAVIMGPGAASGAATITDSVIVGFNSGTTVSNITNSVIIGSTTATVNTPNNTVAIGYKALWKGGGGSNTCIGYNAAQGLTTGIRNTAIGCDSAGAGAGSAWAGAEGNNLCVANVGVAAETNTIHIGNSAHTVNYTAGVYGITPGGATQTVIVNANGQLGSTASLTGPGSSVDNHIVAFSGTSGKSFKDTGVLMVEYTSVDITRPGVTTTFLSPGAANTYHVATVDSYADIVLAGSTLSQATIASGAVLGLTGIGAGVFPVITAGLANTACGAGSMAAFTSGSDNTTCGTSALGQLITGNRNIAIGSSAGLNLTGGNDNIMIASAGVLGDAATIRIGTAQTLNYQAGIHGVTPGGATQVVVVDATGQLGSTAAVPTISNFSTAVAPSLPIGLPAATFTAQKIGNLVTLRVNGYTTALGSPTASFVFAALLTAAFRPATATMFPMIFYSLGAYDTGLVGSVLVEANGSVSMIRDMDAAPANFDGTAGWLYDISVSYISA